MGGFCGRRWQAFLCNTLKQEQYSTKRITGDIVNQRFGCLQAAVLSVVERRGDKRQLVEEEDKKGLCVCGQEEAGSFPVRFSFALSDGLSFRDRTLIEEGRISSDVYIQLIPIRVAAQFRGLF